MWQNNIQTLWKSIQEARPSRILCESIDPKSGATIAKSYLDLVSDLNCLDNHFKNQIQLKILILMEKSYESLLLITFCLLKGHCFIPVPPSSKSLEQIVSNVKPDCKETVNSIQEILLNPVDAKFDFRLASIEPDHLAYIISTSGTTGTPKLIPISYRNFDSYVSGVMKVIPSDLSFCLIQNFEISFDPYFFDLVAVLTNKSCVYPLAHADLRHFASIIKARSQKSVWLSLTPTQGDLLLSLNQTMKFPSVDRTFFLGEKLKRNLCENWLKAFPNTKIFNMYGPAEATVSVSCHQYDSTTDVEAFVPIGAFHTELQHTISENSELLLKGDQVFSGYLGSNTKQDSWYNTHDIVELKHAKMYVIGRSDAQVKINGRRIEVQEIEVELESHGLNGFIVPVFSELENKIKTSLVYATKMSSITIEQLNEFLSKKFDPDVIPKKVFNVEHYPLSQNGKIDRKQLALLIEKLQ